MLKDLASFLHRSSSRDNLGRFILVSDSLVDGGFLIHHYITQALQGSHTLLPPHHHVLQLLLLANASVLLLEGDPAYGHLTYLVSFAQSFIHYNSIATKLGVNLTRHEENGSFVFIDCLTHLLSESDQSEESASLLIQKKKDEITTLSSGSRCTFSLSSDLSLCSLYQQVLCSIKGTASEPDRPVCLVVDDLSILLSLGVKLTEIVSFVSYCRHLLLSPEGPCSGTGYLVAMVHCDGTDSDEQEQLLRRHLLHSCHISLHVEGLATGYSKDVHGNLRVEWRDPGGHEEEAEGTRDASLVKTAQYRLTDRSVQLFAKGTSSAVL